MTHRKTLKHPSGAEVLLSVLFAVLFGAARTAFRRLCPRRPE